MKPAFEENMGKVAVIVPAGGRGQRFGGGTPKQFTDLAGWPVLAHTLARFDQTSAVDQIVVVAPKEQVENVRRNIVDQFGFSKVIAVVAGGATRQESVIHGFLALDEDVDVVLIHDGVRPLVGASTIEGVIEATREHGAAIAAVKVRDTLKKVEDHVIQGTLDRQMIWQAQTPQGFSRHILAQALAAAGKDGFAGTDEATLVERLGQPVRVVPGAQDNIKITMPEDLILAETLIEFRGRSGRGCA